MCAHPLFERVETALTLLQPRRPEIADAVNFGRLLRINEGNIQERETHKPENNSRNHNFPTRAFRLATHASSPNYSIRTRQHLRRDYQTDLLRRYQIDDEFEF